MEPSKYWFIQNVTMRSTTELVKVEFRDMETGTYFKSTTVEITVPSSNTSSVSYAFTEDAAYRDSVAKDTTKTIQFKKASKIYVLAGTAGDTVVVKAW